MIAPDPNRPIPLLTSHGVKCEPIGWCVDNHAAYTVSGLDANWNPQVITITMDITGTNLWRKVSAVIRKTKGLTVKFLSQFTEKQLDDYLRRLKCR